ncbi:MAG: metal-dependent hydrolase, partial [Gemmatimonadales bacterium]
MDPLCHTLVGGALAESGLKRRTRLGTATLLIGANLPDVDVAAVFTGSDLAFRRGWTHGVLAWVALPLAVTGIMLLWNRIRRSEDDGGRPVLPRQVLLLATLSVLTHPLLDWLNTYGVRLLMPFSVRWFYGDCVFIVDPWIWLLLGSGVLWSRLHARQGRNPATRPARAALALTVIYIGLMVAGTASGRRIAARDLRLQSLPSKNVLMVEPVPFIPFQRQVVLAERDRYRFGRIHWWPGPRIALSGDSVLKGFDDPRVSLVEPTEASRQLLEWARFPYYVVEGAPGRRRLRLDDALQPGSAV